MTSLTRAQALRGALAAALTLATPALAQPAGARGVTAVTCPEQRFVQLANRRWEERGNAGGRFSFVETHRDGGTIYLIDSSRGVRLQLDLRGRRVMYADQGAPQPRYLYDIIGVSSQVNGENVSLVRHAQGVFRMTSPGQWGEFGNDGGQFSFEERARDEWSVYLLDRSRGVEIQLDLHTRKIMYSAMNEPRRPLYDITGASAQ